MPRMEFIGITTRALVPPKDDLHDALRTSSMELRDGDVVVVSSKVLAIHQGRCLPVAETDKLSLVAREADYHLPLSATPHRKKPSVMTIKGHTIVSSGGIDQSNGNGFYILWPEPVAEVAAELHRWLCGQYGVSRLAVIVTDSHSVPLRLGTMGTAIACYGLEPLVNYIGKPDVFGRPLKWTRQNVMESLAAGAALLMGEAAECVPVVVARNAPGLSFVDRSTYREGVVSIPYDKFEPLLRVFEKNHSDV